MNKAFTLLFLLSIIFMSFFGADAANKDKPNIVFIYLDDLDNNMVGCYNANFSTPNIDAIAKNGIKFNRYYPSSPVCTPSRFSALTGKYASRSTSDTFLIDSPLGQEAFIRWNTDISERDTTIGKVLQKQGYRTGLVGKWHLGFPNYEPLALPYDANPEDPKVAKFIKDNYRDTKEYVQNIAGFDEILSFYSINMRWIPVPQALDKHNQDWVDRGATSFIENNKNKPFFLYVATTLPHKPPALDALRARAATPLGFEDLPAEEAAFRKQLLAEVKTLPAGINKEDYAATRWIDNGIGRIMKKLRELKLEEKTIVIVASDNDNRSKMALYDNKVPFVMQWKGTIPAGQVCEELVSNIDFAPTFYDYANAKVSKDITIDGLSLRPLIEKKTESLRDSVFMEILYTRGVITKDWSYLAVRYPEKIMKKITPENRKMYSHEGTTESANDGVTTGIRVRYGIDKTFPHYFDFDQLYNLERDPQQQRNLAYEKEYELQLLKMKKEISKYSKSLPYPFGEF